jgi:hypothetical protein
VERDAFDFFILLYFEFSYIDGYYRESIHSDEMKVVTVKDRFRGSVDKMPSLH